MGPDTFVTASEDRTVAVWDKRHHRHVLLFPYLVISANRIPSQPRQAHQQQRAARTRVRTRAECRGEW